MLRPYSDVFYVSPEKFKSGLSRTLLRFFPYSLSRNSSTFPLCCTYSMRTKSSPFPKTRRFSLAHSLLSFVSTVRAWIRLNNPAQLTFASLMPTIQRCIVLRSSAQKQRTAFDSRSWY